MPTGYTAGLYEGEQSFEDFAWGVARGFGALITMRDDPSDAPVPDEFQPSSYHRDAIQEAKDDLAALARMTDAEIMVEQSGKYHEAKQHRARYISDRQALGARYRRMLEKAIAWEPPTPDHVKFKETMVEQLEQSIEFDCGGSYAPALPEMLTADEYRTKVRAKLEHDVAYHEAEYAKEVERAEQRTAWVRALRDSLDGAHV